MTKGGFYNTIPLRDQLKKTMIGYDKKPLLSTVSVCILNVQPTSKKKGDSIDLYYDNHYFYIGGLNAKAKY